MAYLQRLVLNVDKSLFDDEIYFWKNAMGMRVTREVRGDTGKSVILAFGQETLDADDGWGGEGSHTNPIQFSSTSDTVSQSAVFLCVCG